MKFLLFYVHFWTDFEVGKCKQVKNLNPFDIHNFQGNKSHFNLDIKVHKLNFSHFKRKF